MEMLFCEWPVFVFALFPTCSLVGGGFLSSMIASNRTTIKTKKQRLLFFLCTDLYIWTKYGTKTLNHVFNEAFLYVLLDRLPSCLEKFAT